MKVASLQPHLVVTADEDSPSEDASHSEALESVTASETNRQTADDALTDQTKRGFLRLRDFLQQHTLHLQKRKNAKRSSFPNQHRALKAYRLQINEGLLPSDSKGIHINHAA